MEYINFVSGGFASFNTRYNIGNVDQTASMSMLTLSESRYTLKGRYNIGNVYYVHVINNKIV